MTEETSRKHEAVLGEQEMIMMSNNTTTTEEQVLAWLIEKLTLQGAVGLFTDWLPEHFSSIWTIEVNPSDPFSDFTTEGFDLMACLDHSIREHSREEWLGQITTQNSSLYPRVVKLVESKLLARGISQERLQSLTPREKLIMLAEADLLRAPPQAKFILYLITAAKDVKGNNTRESTKLFFPHTTAFTHFQAVLRDFTLPSAIRTGRTTGYTLLDGPWIYRLIGPNKVIIPGLPKYSIADETDFREMKRRLQNKDTPTACIFHVSLSPSA